MKKYGTLTFTVPLMTLVKRRELLSLAQGFTCGGWTNARSAPLNTGDRALPQCRSPDAVVPEEGGSPGHAH